MSAILLKHHRGIYYFDVDHFRTVAVSDVEVETAKIADAALTDDATHEDRARYLAQVKARIANEAGW